MYCMQVTSSQLFFSEFSCLATSGPTHEQQPVFQWSTSGFHPTPLGHPDKWAFSPVWVRWNNWILVLPCCWPGSSLVSSWATVVTHLYINTSACNIPRLVFHNNEILSLLKCSMYVPSWTQRLKSVWFSSQYGVKTLSFVCLHRHYYLWSEVSIQCVVWEWQWDDLGMAQ